MALPPESYEKARREAQLHVQVELNPVSEKVEERCEYFPLTGKIVRIFRGHRICRVGDILNFDVAVISDDYSPIFFPPGGTIWLRYSDLLSNKYIEVYLNGKPPNCHVALCQYSLIPAPTEEPVMFSYQYDVTQASTEQKPPFSETIPSGYDPMGQVYLEGRAYRNISEGNLRGWVVISNWIIFGIPNIGLFLWCLYELVSRIQKIFTSGLTIETFFIILILLFGLFCSSLVFSLLVKGAANKLSKKRKIQR